jgi:hypothetical protein
MHSVRYPLVTFHGRNMTHRLYDECCTNIAAYLPHTSPSSIATVMASVILTVYAAPVVSCSLCAVYLHRLVTTVR